MTRNLKSLGLLVGALLALGAMMASAASAHVPARFTSEQSSTTIRGVHDSGAETTKFTVTGQNTVCGIEEFHGTQSGTSTEEVTIKPTYTECEAFGFLEAKVTGFGHYGEPAANQCDYVLKANNRADLVCPAGRDVTVEVGSTCIAHIPGQSNLGSITYTTGTRSVKHDLTLDINLTGITVTHTDENFLCPFSGSGEIGTATLTGKATAWGQDPTSGAAVGVTWDATTA